MRNETAVGTGAPVFHFPIRKRIFDVVLGLILLPILAFPIMLIALLIAICDGRPIFYHTERIGLFGRCFSMWKFRTMTVSRHKCCVPGGEELKRVTALGRWLRVCRLDELPQLWNILRGDMSFVGPRPPLSDHVKIFPQIYAEILQMPPGVTGLASLIFHTHEEKLLRHCLSEAETERVYRKLCIPRKARLDQIYQRHQTVWFDLWIMWKTCGVMFGRMANIMHHIGIPKAHVRMAKMGA